MPSRFWILFQAWNSDITRRNWTSDKVKCISTSALHTTFPPRSPNLPERNPSHFKHEPCCCCLITVMVFIRHKNNFFYTLKGNSGSPISTCIYRSCKRKAEADGVLVASMINYLFQVLADKVQLLKYISAAF